MKKPLTKAKNRETSAEAQVLEVELQIARRADELWRAKGVNRGSDVEFWLEAEREIIGDQRSIPLAVAGQVGVHE